MKKLIILILLNSCNPAFAKFQASISEYNFKTSADYRTIKSDYRPNISLGYFTQLDDLTFTLLTNRLTPLYRTDQIEKDNTYLSKQTLSYVDTISIGYLIKSFKIAPSLFLSRIDTKTKIYSNNQIINNKHSIGSLHGVSLSYFINKHVYTSFIIILPNHKFDLTTSEGLSVTLLF